MRSVVPDLALPSTCFRLEVLFYFSYILSAVLDLVLGSVLKFFLTHKELPNSIVVCDSVYLHHMPLAIGIMQEQPGFEAEEHYSHAFTGFDLELDMFLKLKRNSYLVSK